MQSCGISAAKEELSLKREMAECRKVVWDRGAERGVSEDGVTLARKGFSWEEMKAMIAKGGVVPGQEAVNCRVRSFADGGVQGSRAFVDVFFQRYRNTLGLRRVDGAGNLRGIAIAGVFCLRALRAKVFA